MKTSKFIPVFILVLLLQLIAVVAYSQDNSKFVSIEVKDIAVDAAIPQRVAPSTSPTSTIVNLANWYLRTQNTNFQAVRGLCKYDTDGNLHYRYSVEYKGVLVEGEKLLSTVHKTL